MTEQERLQKAKEEYSEWVEMHDGMVPSEDLQEFEEDAAQRWWLIQQAEQYREFRESAFSIIQLAHLDGKSSKQALKQIENLIIDSWEQEGDTNA